jgi:hypothetical protein
MSILFIVTLFSCDNKNSLKEKELELKEKELNIREKELAQKQEEKKKNISSPEQKKTIQQTQPENKKTRKLRYLYFANGGLVGYFDDGTISGCPRCDFASQNVKALYTIKPHMKYTIEKGYLLVDGSQREYPKGNPSVGEGWAMIDYKWQITVPD